MQQTLLEQGMDLLLYGMGTVFVFLTILVFCTLLMSRFVASFFPEAPEPVEPTVPLADQPVSNKTLAVIQAAIREHRAKKR
jgi:oxaloacetate decarboxylase gamma subunit